MGRTLSLAIHAGVFVQHFAYKRWTHVLIKGQLPIAQLGAKYRLLRQLCVLEIGLHDSKNQHSVPPDAH